jgi:hypothetical protein
MILLLSVAMAQRPDQGGIYSFDSSDQLETLDGPMGLVRVTYSVAGTNQTVLDDDDGSGLPDFPEQVALHAEAVLEMYAAMGFRAPISEADMGIELGGSPAFDFYLVDFAGTADGQFATDRCQGQVCSGFMIMENDFKNYGYPSKEDGIRTLTSHELFHAVQAAYRNGQDSWLSEGTATWSEYQYDNGNRDFFSLCTAYLADPGRSLDKPPAGSVSSWSYGTALFWTFLSERYGPGVIVDVQEAQDSLEGLDAVEAALTAAGTSWDVEWPIFVEWNLGAGSNGGVLESYPFASRLIAPAEVDQEPALADSNRFYPLAASYYTLEHVGGPVVFATLDDPTGLRLALYPVDNGVVGEALWEQAPTAAGRWDIGELPAGNYKFVGTYPQRAAESVKIDFCLGLEADVASCLPAADSGDSAPPADDSGKSAEEPSCGCNGGAAAAPGGLLLGLLALRRRR